jgi:hypothetical protein
MFDSLIEEVRYCVEGGGSRSSKDRRQMAYIKKRRERMGLKGDVNTSVFKKRKEKMGHDGVVKSLYRGSNAFGQGRGKLPKDPK